MARQSDKARAEAAKMKGLAIRLANLIPGIAGKRSKFLIDYQGLQRTSFAIAAKLVEFEDGLKNRHAGMLRTVGDRARANLRASILRPAERHSRPNARMTGRFTFGTVGGGTFRGVVLDEPQRSFWGFGYPNVKVADAATRFVWRSLEYGLGARGTKDPEGPRGGHKMPFPFYFRPTAYRSGALFLRKGVRRAVDQFPGGSRPQGFEGKFFIRRAMESVIEEAPRQYEKVVGETWGRL